jgi:hypothetical protein
MLSLICRLVPTVAIGVGAYYLLKYSDNNSYSNSFTIDRIVDDDCMDNVLYIGVNGNGQGMRIGLFGKIKKLLHFEKDEDKLVYTFEDRHILTIHLTEKEDLMYSLESPKIKVEYKHIHNSIRYAWKTISLNSTELDELLKLK